MRLRTDAAKRFKKVANATAVIGNMLMIAEQIFSSREASKADGGGVSRKKFVDGKQLNT